MLQTSLTDLIVLLCGAYVLWTLLLPVSARQRVAQALLRWPLPINLKVRLQRWTMKPASGCASCAKAEPLPLTEAPQPIRVVRRKSV